MERTFVMVKPDGVKRGLVGEVIRNLERKGYRLSGIKMLQMDKELAVRHYTEHEGKPFFAELVRYITSGPVVAMVWEGPLVIRGVRVLVGATNPLDADPGSLRGRFAADVTHNLVHASDSYESAEREIGLYFNAEEICSSVIMNN